MRVGRIEVVRRLGEIEPEVPGAVQLLTGHVLQVQVVLTEQLHLDIITALPQAAPCRRGTPAGTLEGAYLFAVAVVIAGAGQIGIAGMKFPATHSGAPPGLALP